MPINVTTRVFDTRKITGKHTGFTRKIAYDLLKGYVQQEKEVLIENFKSHPVTQELENHSSLDSSAYIIGEGTLFGFIGFERSKKPIEEVLDLLQRGIYVINQPKDGSIKDRVLTYIFPIQIPTKQRIEEVSPMPKWSSGSWVYAIQNGISGITFYLFQLNKGRSGEGKQTESEGYVVNKNAKFIPVRDYLPSMLNEFRKKLKLPFTDFS